MIAFSRPSYWKMFTLTIIGIIIVFYFFDNEKTISSNQHYEFKSMVEIKTDLMIELEHTKCRGKIQEFNNWLKNIEPLMKHLTEKQVSGRAKLQGHVWNFKGNVFLRMPQLCTYYSVLKEHKSHIKTVCETGFNGGHSALMFRSILGSSIEIISFDLCQSTNCEIGKKEILDLFPDTKLKIIKGDSTVTVPLFVKTYPTKKCDFISIDGGHFGQVPYLDLRNMKFLAADGHIFVIDDVNSSTKPSYLKDVKDALEKAIAENIIEPITNCTLCYTHDSSGAGCHFCFGNFII